MKTAHAKDFWKIVDELIAHKIIPVIQRPQDFSRWLIATHLSGDAEIQRLFGGVDEWRPQFAGLLHSSYRPTLKRYFQTFYPKGIRLYRGIHSLPDTASSQKLLALAMRPGGGSDDRASFSENVAMAVRGFAAATDFRRRQQIPGHAGVLVVVDVRLEQVLEFGGDSESGWLNEAEVRVASACYPSCVTSAFVLSSRPIRGAKPVSATDRSTFALEKTRIIPLGNDTNVCLHPEVAYRGSKLATTTFAGFEWSRIPT